MTGFRDIHVHMIYGVDDGAQTRDDMFQMIDAAHEEGIARIFTTPHVTPGVKPFPYDRYRRHLEIARAYVQQKGYGMELQEGAELLYTPAIRHYAQERELPTLGDTDFILMEFVPDIPLKELTSALDIMQSNGYTTILAHIERYDCMFRGSAYRIKDDYSVEYQVNCGTITRDKAGFFRTREVRHWFEDQLIDYVGTDAHNTSSRPPHMRHAYETLKERYGIQYAAKLTGMPIRKKSEAK